ncbi:MAG: hypothetical protein IJ251_05540 [Oscillospiraceae bacterium]|nr:hypothetical protein [Oscillospiraceae bacterium]
MENSVFLLILLILLSGADRIKDTSDRIRTGHDRILYSSDKVTAEAYAPSSVRTVSETVWDTMTIDEFRKDVSAVSDCTVEDAREVRITYLCNGTPHITYKKIYTLSVQKNIWGTAKGDRITVAFPESSYADSPDIPDLSKGDEIILFLRDTSSLENDPMELRGYADHYVSCPADIAYTDKGYDKGHVNADAVFSGGSGLSPIDTDLLEGEIIEEDRTIYDIPDTPNTLRAVIPKNDFYNNVIGIMNRGSE